jgi:hypothetical protein
MTELFIRKRSISKNFFLIETLLAMVIFSICSAFLFKSLAISKKRIKESVEAFEYECHCNETLSKFKEELFYKESTQALLKDRYIKTIFDDYIVKASIAKQVKGSSAYFPVLMKIEIFSEKNNKFNPKKFWHTIYVESSL